MNHRHFAKSSLLAIALSALAASPAAAQDAAGDDLNAGDIVVTAQKRAENIQDVPLSIIAVSGAMLEERNISDFSELQMLVPNLRITSIAQASGVALRIRGFGASSNAAIDPSVAPYIDGVFLPRPGAILTSFLDVAGVEVLRGPQGTLFGRNATVGAISLKTNAPNLRKTSGRVAVEAGSYGRLLGEGMINVPLSETFGLRLAGLASSTNGFVRNQLDGQRYGKKDDLAGRLSLRFNPSDTIDWIVRADYARTTGDGVNLSQVDVATATPQQLANYTARLGGNPSTLTYSPSIEANQLFTNLDLHDRQWGVSSDLNVEVGNGFTVRLINSYRDWQNRQSDGDVVGTPLDLANRDSTFYSKSHSHEVQFISPTDQLLGGKLDFVAGLYYFNEDYRIGEDFNLGARYCSFAVAAASAALLPACNAGPTAKAAVGVFDQTATSKAMYAQADIGVLANLKFTMGARYTWDNKKGDFVQTIANQGARLLRAAENTSLAFKDDRFSWRANLGWDVADDVMAFLTYSTGYKSGGLNSAGGTAALGQRRLFGSETAKDWELGVKSRLFDRALTLNATLFRTDLNNFQERSFDGTSFIVRNAGSIRAQGLELEGQARLSRAVQVDFALAHLDSKFTDNRTAPGLPACNGSATSCPTVQNLTGRRAPSSPPWQGNLGLQMTSEPFIGDTTATVRVAMSYMGSTYSSPDLNPQSRVDGYALLSARVTLQGADDSWSLALFGENLANNRYFTTKFAQVLDAVMGVRVPANGTTLMRGFVGAPLTIGARLTKNF